MYRKCAFSQLLNMEKVDQIHFHAGMLDFSSQNMLLL